MAGLPHFNNATASSKFYEPYYPNKFEANVLPPNGVAGGDILIEHVKNIEGLNIEPHGEAASQKYKTSTRRYAQDPEDTGFDVTLTFTLNLNDDNQLYVYKTLRDWKHRVFNPRTGEKGLKKDYVGTIVVVNYNRAGDIFWQRTLHSCFPSGEFPELPMDWETAEPAEMAVTFSCDWADEVMS